MSSLCYSLTLVTYGLMINYSLLSSVTGCDKHLLDSYCLETFCQGCVLE